MTAAALVAAVVFALGGIWFGRFEEGAPKWRRSLKLALTVGLTAAVARFFGTGAGIGFIALFAACGLTFHFAWCRRHAIDPWRAEPHDRYRKLRGWA